MGIEESLFKVDDKIDEVVVVVQDTEEIVIEISEWVMYELCHIPHAYWSFPLHGFFGGEIVRTDFSLINRFQISVILTKLPYKII